MGLKEPSFTLGIEEEYYLVDKTTRDLVPERPDSLIGECQEELREFGGQVSPEFMRSQIEVGTKVCHSLREARSQLAHMRATISRCAGHYGIAPIAASTHPFAKWSAQQHTDKERYNVIADDLQMIGRRLLVSGMHVHVAIEDEKLRIDVMNQAS